MEGSSLCIFLSCAAATAIWLARDADSSDAWWWLEGRGGVVGYKESKTWDEKTQGGKTELFTLVHAK